MAIMISAVWGGAARVTDPGSGGGKCPVCHSRCSSTLGFAVTAALSIKA